MNRSRQFVVLAAIAALVATGITLNAQDGTKKAKGQKQGAAVARGLTNPCGLAIQPGSGHLFVGSKEGVTRVDLETGEAHLEIASAGNDVYGKGPMYDIAALGLAFHGKEMLVVGGGGRPDGEELVLVFKVAADDAGDHEPMTEKDAVTTLGPITAKEGVTAKGEGNFYGIAVANGKVFVTCNGDDTKGWIATADLAGKGTLTPTIATKIATNVDAPVPVTFSKDGQLVVGQMGEVNVAGDSLLCFYDAKTGELQKSFETGLSDIAGLAYSPKTGKLYATDFSWVDAAAGGLYELTIEGDTVEAKLIRKLDKPTALAFDDSGALYVAVFGTPKEGAKKPSGRVIKIDKGL